MEKVDILGVEIDNFSPQEVLEKVKIFLNSGEQNYIVTPNPEFLVAAGKNDKFKEILNFADIAVADGVGLIFAAKFLGQKLQRVTGVDLMILICELAEEMDYSIYLLGAKDLVAAATAEEILKYHPKLRIVGAESGGIIDNPRETADDLVERINDAAPDILFVAFGQIKQEEWIYYHLDRLPSVKLAAGVGGAFDFISGTVSRAPFIMRKIGLEWLYRLIIQPSRWRRIYNAVVVFPWLIFVDKFFNKFFKHGTKT